MISSTLCTLIYILSHRQADKYFTRICIIDPSPRAFKQRRGDYFYYNRAAIGLACAQATAMRIDIAPHNAPTKTTPQTSPHRPRYCSNKHTRHPSRNQLACSPLPCHSGYLFQSCVIGEDGRLAQLQTLIVQDCCHVFHVHK